LKATDINENVEELEEIQNNKEVHFLVSGNLWHPATYYFFERILTSMQALKGRLPTLREVIRFTSEGGRLKDMSAKLNGSEK
jgi:hypothetical protein